MSKGTKQIRLGRVERFIELWEATLQALEDMNIPGEFVAGQITGEKLILEALKKEFEL